MIWRRPLRCGATYALARVWVNEQLCLRLARRWPGGTHHGKPRFSCVLAEGVGQRAAPPPLCPPLMSRLSPWWVSTTMAPSFVYFPIGPSSMPVSRDRRQLIGGPPDMSDLPCVIHFPPSLPHHHPQVAADAPPLEIRLSNCTDVAPGTRHTCEQQRMFGKCDSEFMVG